MSSCSTESLLTMRAHKLVGVPVAPESEPLLGVALLNGDEELFTGMRLAGEGLIACLALMGRLLGLLAGVKGDLPSDLTESFRVRLDNKAIGVPVSL